MEYYCAARQKPLHKSVFLNCVHVTKTSASVLQVCVLVQFKFFTSQYSHFESAEYFYAINDNGQYDFIERRSQRTYI